MDSKELKSLLKEARDQMKNKEYSQSLKTCKIILKLDRDNYMALVFLGKSMQEVGPKEQAIHAFKKAINLNPDQTLAWNGLASFFEKDDTSDAKRELLNIYKKLLDLELDHLKIKELIEKYVNTAIYLQDTVESIKYLHDFSINRSKSDQINRIVWLAIASLFNQTKEIPNDLLSLYENALEIILKEPSTSIDYYKEYLKIIYKLKNYEKLFVEAINMFNIYNDSTYALEWICKIYVELAVEGETLADIFEPKVKIYYERLLQIQAEAVMGIFVKAVLAFRQKEFTTAIEHLKKVVEVRSSLVHAWVLLSECFLLFCDYDEAVNAAVRADNILQVITREKLKKKLDKIRIAALARHSDEKKILVAIELSEKMESLNEDILESVIHAYLTLGNFEKNYNLIKEMSILNKDKSILLQIYLLHKQDRLKEALSLLNDSKIESCDAYLEIGKLNWELGQHEDSLVPFLKAAKLNPDSFDCFVCLGKYYEEMKDFEKARRCYQKAYKLNPRCAEAGIGLSNIYRQMKNYDANLTLLNSVTGGIASIGIRGESVHWAWLQLGLHHLHSGNHDLSVEWLRKLVRAKPQISNYWECLADAYLARGSFVSAIRSFERAVELSAGNLYSKLQVANIKLKIGYYDEAKKEFEDILKTNKKYVPALKGLGETCLLMGMSRDKLQRLGSCQQFIQQALDNFTIALREQGDLSCVWKFIGDCCYVVAMLPEKYSCMVVHPSLSDKPNKFGDYEIMGKEELFILAARCYCKAITLCKTDNIMLWQDLANCYYTNGLYEKALSVARYCVQEDPTNYIHWNLLGAIYFRLNNCSLSQHCFIKSVTLNHNSATSWCNLGVLYHHLGHIKLANKAYSRAQRAEPSHATAWTGQALIAATLKHEHEAMDLFRHSSQLGYGDISAINYGSAVCQLICENEEAINSYEIRDMHAIPTAWDLLSWYIEHHDEDSCAWNILGILSERLGLQRSALRAFEQTVSLLNPGKNRNLALVNYGRRLTADGRYEKAISMLNSITEASFTGGCTIALAQFKSGEYEQSYDTYESTMQWLAESENLQSHVLVALASMAYMFQRPDSAKTLLFQSTQLSPPSKYGLYATFSLGLLHSDYNLARLVLKELESMKDQPDVVYHCAFLDTYTYFLQGDKKKSIRCLSKYIHRHPGQASLWLAFSVLLLQTNDKKLSHAALKCAQLSMSLGRSNMDVTKVLCIMTYACMLSGDSKEATRSAQNAVHCYPHVSEGWAMLISVLSYFNEVKKSWGGKKAWIQNSIKYLQAQTHSKELQSWMSTFVV